MSELRDRVTAILDKAAFRDEALKALRDWFHGSTAAPYTAAGHSLDPDDCAACWEAAELSAPVIERLLEALDTIDRLEGENERMRDLAVRQGWVDVSGKPRLNGGNVSGEGSQQ